MDSDDKGNFEDYIEFLQNQVTRLNAVLKVYQRKYLPVDEDDIESEGPLSPWLSNASVLSPLLVEYDNTIHNLKNEVGFYKKEQLSLKQRIDDVIQENGRLLQERRQALEKELNTEKGGLKSGQISIETNMLDNLQRQLEITLKEKDYYVEMLERTSQELEKLHELQKDNAEALASKSDEAKYLQNDLLKARRFAEQLQTTNRKLQTEYDQFLNTAQAQDQEIESTRTEIRRYKNEVKALVSSNEDLKRTLNALQGQMKLREKDKTLLSDKEQDVESRLEEYRTKLIELESRLTAAYNFGNRLKGQNSELEDRIDVLVKKNIEQEKMEYEAAQRVRDSMQLVESAVLERDQVSVREKQKSEEVSRLQEVIQKLLMNAGAKTKEEVEKIKAQYNKNLKKLMEELEYMEMEGAQKQAELERTMREKGAVEKELEKMYQEGPSEIARTGLTMEQLQKRISISEKTKEEALQSRESLTSLMHRMEKKHEQQKTQILLENEELRKRVKQLINESEEIAGNRLSLIDEIDGLKRDLLLAHKAENQAKHKCIIELGALEQRHKVKERLFDEKLRNLEKMNNQSVNELREMLSAQQKMGFKWKDESQVLAKKFEETVNTLRNDISKQSKRNDVLNRELVEAKLQRKQIEEDLLATKALLEKAQSIAADSESRAKAASEQVATLLDRERELLRERKDLHQEIEKSRLHRNRPTGSTKRSVHGMARRNVTSARDVPSHRRIAGSANFERNLARDFEFDNGIVAHSSDLSLNH